MHRLVNWGQWAVKPLQCTATPPGGNGPCDPCNALLHCLGVLTTGTIAMHCFTTCGQSAVELLHPHYAGAVGNGVCAIDRLSASSNGK